MNACRPLALCLLTLACRVALPQQPDFHTDPKFLKEVAAAQDTRQRQDARIGHWKKAFKISKDACGECLAQIAVLQIQSGETKEAAITAAALKQLVTTPGNKAYADVLRGSAFMHMNHDKPRPEQLAEADTAFRAALAEDPAMHMAAYMEGRVLAALNRDDEARASFEAYAKGTPAADRYHTRAEHFAANPALARARMAQPFTVTTADGKSFSLDEMGGRVVLVDFWATWCGPCNRELPHIKRIAQEFAGQPFVLISVSWDEDEGKWHDFLGKNGMDWSQYRDANHALSTAYGVESIPHYFTIDADGILQDEQIGGGDDIDGKLRTLVSRAHEAQAANSQQAQAAVASAPTR